MKALTRLFLQYNMIFRSYLGLLRLTHVSGSYTVFLYFYIFVQASAMAGYAFDAVTPYIFIYTHPSTDL